MYVIVIGQHFQPFCGQSSLSVRVRLGCIAGLGASEGGASWGFMVWVCHYRGALIFGLGVIVCIVCYGTVWLPCHVFSSNVGLGCFIGMPFAQYVY